MPLPWANSRPWQVSIGDLQRPLQRHALLRRLLDHALDVAAGQHRQHHVRLPAFVADVVDGDDVGVVAEAAHGLRLAA